MRRKGGNGVGVEVEVEEEEQARAVKRERLSENENAADDQDPASRRVIRSEFLKLKTLINGNNLSFYIKLRNNIILFSYF